MSLTSNLPNVSSGFQCIGPCHFNPKFGVKPVEISEVEMEIRDITYLVLSGASEFKIF